MVPLWDESVMSRSLWTLHYGKAMISKCDSQVALKERILEVKFSLLLCSPFLCFYSFYSWTYISLFHQLCLWVLVYTHAYSSSREWQSTLKYLHSAFIGKYLNYHFLIVSFSWFSFTLLRSHFWVCVFWFLLFLDSLVWEFLRGGVRAHSLFYSSHKIWHIKGT